MVFRGWNAAADRRRPKAAISQGRTALLPEHIITDLALSKPMTIHQKFL